MTIGKKVLFVLFVFMFIAGGVNHFVNPEFYFQLMHYIIPPGNGELNELLIYISGATEILAGLLFIIPQTRRLGALFILLHLIAFLPIHVAMCFVELPNQNPNMVYVAWVRLIVQFMLIYWIATFKTNKTTQI
ncbi:MAG: hypothetical protein M0D57_09250 [Sphingobacteriales bacterium JAD_PAG50586_3]|nr:MAG: hypothetical protein M0D57_09250 [Sphingobacteriales bacterium JAD_PAG50586_3]